MIHNLRSAAYQAHLAGYKENVLAFGNPGSGKTHLLCAIGQELVRAGRSVYFRSTNLLVQELLVAKRDLKLSRVLKRLSQCEVLLIDDIGYVQQSREEMEVLFTFLAERYERRSRVPHACPSHTAARDSTTESATLLPAIAQRPSWASSSVCRLKLEKVV